jgi:hypothetical protein
VCERAEAVNSSEKIRLVDTGSLVDGIEDAADRKLPVPNRAPPTHACVGEHRCCLHMPDGATDIRILAETCPPTRISDPCVNESGLTLPPAVLLRGARDGCEETEKIPLGAQTLRSSDIAPILLFILLLATGATASKISRNCSRASTSSRPFEFSSPAKLRRARAGTYLRWERACARRRWAASSPLCSFSGDRRMSARRVHQDSKNLQRVRVCEIVLFRIHS